MKKHIVIIAIMAFSLLSGGCAVVPALVTTGASFAVPQTASLAITAAGTVHKTALIAADERNVDDMLADKVMTIQAQAKLLDEAGATMEATCLNGDIYLVGEYATPADRDNVIREMQEIDGVKSVKGVVKQMPTSLVALVEPTITDKHAETVIETGLIGELHIKSANVDVSVVQGEAVVVGVVRDKAEAEAVIDIVEGLRPEGNKPVKVTSLLALQDSYEAGLTQENVSFALLTQRQMLAVAKPVDPVIPHEEAPPVPVVDDPAPTAKRETPQVQDLQAYFAHLDISKWQMARLKMKRRILKIAQAEHDPRTKKELIRVSTKILKDRHTSIEDRLVKTLHATSDLTVKRHMNSILSDVAPHRTERIAVLAMN